MAYVNPQDVIDKKTALTFENLRKREHQYVSGVYQNRESVLVVYCSKHDEKHTTTFYNYNRTSTGTPCCSNEARRQKLEGRTFSPETIERMRVANSQRPNRGGQPRRWRETATYRNWRTRILEVYNYKCTITHSSSEDERELVVHHLVGASSCYHLKYHPLNGIVITQELHTLFHNTYGYDRNTVEQFICFLDLLLEKVGLIPKNTSSATLLHRKESERSTRISSQASFQQEEGSETRVYDSTRIKKLQERLKEISMTLAQDLTAALPKAQRDEETGPSLS